MLKVYFEISQVSNFRVKSSITKDTNIVIYEKETSSKYKKAEKLGIQRITEEEYNKMLEGVH